MVTDVEKKAMRNSLRGKVVRQLSPAGPIPNQNIFLSLNIYSVLSIYASLICWRGRVGPLTLELDRVTLLFWTGDIELL